MAGFNTQSRHALIATADADRLTGLSPTQLLAERDVQEFTRIRPDGMREEMLRVPIELVRVDGDGATD